MVISMDAPVSLTFSLNSMADTRNNTDGIGRFFFHYFTGRSSSSSCISNQDLFNNARDLSNSLITLGTISTACRSDSSSNTGVFASGNRTDKTVTSRETETFYVAWCLIGTSWNPAAGESGTRGSFGNFRFSTPSP